MQLGLLFFVPALILSIVTPLFLTSLSVSLSYFILAVPMSECLGRHSCMSFPFPVAILTYFFSRRSNPCFVQSLAYQNLIILQLICKSRPG